MRHRGPHGGHDHDHGDGGCVRCSHHPQHSDHHTQRKPSRELAHRSSHGPSRSPFRNPPRRARKPSHNRPPGAPSALPFASPSEPPSASAVPVLRRMVHRSGLELQLALAHTSPPPESAPVGPAQLSPPSALAERALAFPLPVSPLAAPVRSSGRSVPAELPRVAQPLEPSPAAPQLP